jgi:hypothetical protein
MNKKLVLIMVCFSSVVHGAAFLFDGDCQQPKGAKTAFAQFIKDARKCVGGEMRPLTSDELNAWCVRETDVDYLEAREHMPWYELNKKVRFAKQLNEK